MHANMPACIFIQSHEAHAKADALVKCAKQLVGMPSADNANSQARYVCMCVYMYVYGCYAGLRSCK